MQGLDNDPMILRSSIPILLAIALLPHVCLHAEDIRPPSESEIKAAIEHGNQARKRTEAAPGVIGRNAFIIKAGGVRCGHGMTTIEEARGEKGAVYRLTEQSKSALANDEGGAVLDFKGVYLLDGGLGVLDATLNWTEKLTTKENKQQTEKYTCFLKVADGKLTWSANWDSPKNEDAIALHGQTPVPQSILIWVAALAEAGNIDTSKPLCVLELWPINQQEPIDIQPVWISFKKDRVNDKPRTQVTLTHLVGEVTEKGLTVDLKNNVWKQPQTWMLDQQFHVISQPPTNTSLTVETVDPEKLEPDTPLDLAKISAAMQGDGKK
jgi:hypothetical protein